MFSPNAFIHERAMPTCWGTGSAVGKLGPGWREGTRAARTLIWVTTWILKSVVFFFVLRVCIWVHTILYTVCMPFKSPVCSYWLLRLSFMALVLVSGLFFHIKSERLQARQNKTFHSFGKKGTWTLLVHFKHHFLKCLDWFIQYRRVLIWDLFSMCLWFSLEALLNLVWP